MSEGGPRKAKSPSQMIDERVAELDDWRGAMLSRLRALIKEVDPEAVEAWKWRGVPVWCHDGIICTGETYKSVVKMTFAKGAALDDASCLFNASLDGNTRRALAGPHCSAREDSAERSASQPPPGMRDRLPRRGARAAVIHKGEALR